jgi:hypothetical protein
MRFLIAVLILSIAAPGLGAQQRIESPLRTAGKQPVPELAAPADAVLPTLELAVPVQSQAVTEAHGQQGAQAVILDEAFWRQVLAGVIVAVVSTLILRAIL